MTENINKAPITDEKDAKPPKLGGLQFNDGRIGVGVSEKGDVFGFGEKHTNPEDGPTVVIVKTESGARYALGNRVMVELPQLDHATGDFGRLGDKVKAVRIEDLPGGLKDIVIGEPWPSLGNNDPISLAMYDYKNSGPDPAYYQVNMPNPFDSAREHLARVREAMDA